MERIYKTDAGFICELDGEKYSPFSTEEELVFFLGVDAPAMRLLGEAGIQVDAELAHRVCRQEAIDWWTFIAETYPDKRSHALGKLRELTT